MKNEQDLVATACRGDAKAFQLLVERHYSMVFAIAYARTTRVEVAEDLAQEVFIRAYLHINSLKHPDRIAAWLSRITHNLASNWKRDDQTATRLAPMIPLDQLPVEPADHTIKSAHDMMAASEETEAVRQAVSLLNPVQREIVMLHYFEGLSKKEIAVTLAIHTTTVWRKLREAERSMRRSLEPILQEAAPAFRASHLAKAHTIALIGAISAMSTASKSALAAASGGKAWAASVSLGVSGLSWAGVAFKITLGTVGTLFSPLLNVLILVYGGMANIAHTRSPRERRFMTWMTWGFVLLVVCSLQGLHKLVGHISQSKMSPEYSRWVLAAFATVVVAVLLIVAIYANRRQQRIQREDQDFAVETNNDRLKSGYLMSAATGYILGGMGWLVLLGWAFRDGILFWMTLIAAVALIAQALYRIKNKPREYHRAMIQTIILMLVYALAAFNWHWNAWKTFLVQRAGIEYSFTMYGRLGWSAIIIALYLFLWQRLHWSYKRTGRIVKKS